MQKSYNIRWRKSDHELIQQEINRYNARLYYQQKKNPDANYLPERASYTKAVESIKTRADFNRYISSLRSFNADTAKEVKRKGQKSTTKWAEKERKKERKRMEKEFARKEEERNRQREQTAKDIGEHEVSLGGVGQGVKRVEMGRITENAVKPTHRDTSKMRDKELKEAIELIDKQLDPLNTRKKKELWQRNYIKAMIREGYPADVINLLKEIDPDDFAVIVDTDEYAKLSFVYDPRELDNRVQVIRNTWTHYAGKRRESWVKDYLNNHPELKEKISQESINEFAYGTRDHIVTDDNVIDLMMAYENERIAFDVDTMKIRAELIHEATQGYFGRAFEDILKAEEKRKNSNKQ